MTSHIGIALSGGGYRATLWGLGALLYLVDAGKNDEVAAVSSVSGGSIANGVLAHEVDLGTVRPADFERRMAPLVRHVCDVGLYFWGPSTNAYVLSVFAGAGVGVVALVAGVQRFTHARPWERGVRAREVSRAARRRPAGTPR